MSIEAWLGYICALTILAATPGPGWAAVVTTSIAKASTTAFAMAIGIAVGDVSLMLLTVIGLAVLAATLRSFFVIVKLCGAAYLIRLSVNLWRNPPRASIAPPSANQALVPFLSGFALTLGNAKVIAFYVGFLPAFVEVNTLTIWETTVLAATTFVVIATVLSGCAVIAARSGHLMKSQEARCRMGRVVGSLLIGTGLVIAVR